MFAFIIGSCIVVPPSAKAAILILSLTFGIGINSEEGVHRYEAQIAQQFVAAGATEEQAAEQIAELNKCYLELKPKGKET